jgi:hypothetical protein
MTAFMNLFLAANIVAVMIANDKNVSAYEKRDYWSLPPLVNLNLKVRELTHGE